MKTRLMTLAIAIATITLSCEKEKNQTPPTNPLSSAVVGESIDTNAFDLGVSLMSDITDSRSYNVHFNLPEMHVSLGGMVSSGSINVKIKQSDNTVIYDHSISSILGNNQEISISPDDYTIEVEFDQASGELGLSVDGQD